MNLLQTSKKAQIVIMTKGRRIPGFVIISILNSDHHRPMIYCYLGDLKCILRNLLEPIELGWIKSDVNSFQIGMEIRYVEKEFRVGDIRTIYLYRQAGISKKSKRIVH
jgi:hypothetical protein